MGFIQRFFIGRNGSDQLNIALLVAAIAFNLLSRLLFRGLFEALCYIAAFLWIFRMISRNLERRQRENAWFLQLIGRGGAKGSRTATQPRTKKAQKDRANFRYLKCPNCKQELRVPKGKGKIRITCPKCWEWLISES